MSTLPIAEANSTYISRADLAKVFTDPRTLLAISQALQSITAVVQGINDVGLSPLWVASAGDLPNEKVVVAGTGVTLDYSTAGQVKINVFVQIDGTTIVTGLRDAADDAAAAALVPPVPIGGLYFNGNVLQVRRV